MNVIRPHRSYRGWSIIRLFTIVAVVLTVHRSPMDAQAEGGTSDMTLRLQQILKETPEALARQHTRCESVAAG